MSPTRIYLAGPEVFLTEAVEIGKRKKAMCKKYGFEGVYSLDVDVESVGKDPREMGFCISEANEQLIKSCQILIANITPFRGPSADVGTAFEMGFAHALGLKVYAYTNVAMPFTERTVTALNSQVKRSQDGKLRDAQGMFVEENGLTDNLMIDGCINASTQLLVVEQAPADKLFTYLRGFEKCLRAAQK